MAAMLVNRFKLRSDVLTYNFSGMGCSSSLICVDLAKHMLRALPNTLALIVNHENITSNWSAAPCVFSLRLNVSPARQIYALRRG